MSVKRTSPELVTIYDAFKAYNGYTLFTPVGAGNVWLVDMQGRFVHRWEMQHRPGDYGLLLTNGNLLYAGKVIPGPLTDIGGFGGVLLEADWDGTIVWKYEDPYMHHDFAAWIMEILWSSGGFRYLTTSLPGSRVVFPGLSARG